MHARLLAVAAVALLCLARPAAAQLPPPPDEKAMADWSFPWGDDVPGVLSVAPLLDKPAGKNGPVVARDGHFYTGDKRVRFVGVNLAFAANFPPKDQADAIAKRLAAFGVNCVRFHHMDNQPFPNGIFADRDLEKLSAEALDRLDYFVAALKAQGVYANLNLHVSRPWSRTKKWPNADKLEGYDKQVDIFHPELIEANKRYARDLLTHVNPYTKARYADEPAVAMVEINNEDTIFLWGGEQKLAELPEPYAGMLQKQWNAWLVKKYGAREKLAAAWAQGAEPLGAELIEDPALDRSKWAAEQHGQAKMAVEVVELASGFGKFLALRPTQVDGTDWHLQYSRSKVKLQKGHFYTLSFVALPLKPDAAAARKLSVSVSMAHEPWGNLGLSRTVQIDRSVEPLKSKVVRLGFTASADDDNGRVTFQVGGSDVPVLLQAVSLRVGGREGLRDGEDPAAQTVARGGLGGADAPARTRDWYDFLQQTDESYFVGMRDWLRNEIGVKAPITGTIGLGMLGTKSQSKMDFVDAHAYWDHPRFPRRQWDMKDWEIKNKPMVDDPAGAALWGLAATRVAGKPFTVTEYNHAHPNEWQAECVPMVFAYAAQQGWDAVFLFDYNASQRWQKGHAENFFSVEGNAAKWAALPLAARAFYGAPAAQVTNVVRVDGPELLDTASQYFYQQWPFLRDVKGATWQRMLAEPTAVSFGPPPRAFGHQAAADQQPWTAGGPGTGRFALADARSAAFVGFAKGPMPAAAGPLTVTRLDTPFAAIQFVSADGTKPITHPDAAAAADRLLLSALARQSAAGEQWDAKRTSVSNQFGKPPAKVEVVKGAVEIAVPAAMDVWALGPDGKRLKQVPAAFEAGRLKFELGTEPTVWYEVVRK
ncbi:MAG TPA: cellulase family glycosylhydrolase [Humisphaera sp.]